MSKEMQELIDIIQKFREERDWEQFHSPKNLAISLSLEASEVLELFQWCSTDESRQFIHDHHKEMEEELADVFIYTLYLAKELKIDLIEAAKKKVALNAKKYPVEKVKGSSKKYTEYQE